MLRISDSNREPTAVEEVEYESLGKRLYERLWAPVDSLVANKSLVFVAPDGALSMVAFSSLIDGEDRYLVERFPIHHLSSGRDVIRLSNEAEPGIGLFALGDPDYDATADDMSVEVAAHVTRNVRSGCGELRDLRATPLPGTRREVEEIVVRWKEATGEPAVVYYGKEAREERFKKEGSGKRTVHLATHGYFLESTCQPDQPEQGLDPSTEFVGENPLLLSGLLLAGANRRRESADTLGVDDGILTAYEVTAMDLSGTEMVVLSACETGLGRVEEGEGVYGLRRAFQLAGARTVLSALWPVSDMATADMIGQIYDRRDESVVQAMRGMQLDMIDWLRQEDRSDHPFTWAGFMATGDWR
jgi:CHAT domain-containing protein